jgi:hypothetical protein
MLTVTPSQRAALARMFERSANERDEENALVGMLYGALYAAESLDHPDAEFWCELTDIVASHGVDSIRNLIKE